MSDSHYQQLHHMSLLGAHIVDSNCYLLDCSYLVMRMTPLPSSDAEWRGMRASHKRVSARAAQALHFVPETHMVPSGVQTVSGGRGKPGLLYGLTWSRGHGITQGACN